MLYLCVRNVMDVVFDRPPARMVVRMPTQINQLFNDESIAVKIIFLDVYTWN